MSLTIITILFLFVLGGYVTAFICLTKGFSLKEKLLAAQVKPNAELSEKYGERRIKRISKTFLAAGLTIGFLPLMVSAYYILFLSPIR